MADRFVPESTFAEGNSAQAITGRLLAGMPTTYDVTEGSFAFDLLATSGLELEGLYLLADQIANQAFATTATGSYLDAQADSVGLQRKEGSFAQVELQFTGTDGTDVPQGTRVTTLTPAGQASQPIVFETLGATEISGTTATATAQAIDLGVLSNVSAGTLVRLETGIVGISEVTNPASAGGGTDPEDDETLRARVLTRKRAGRGAGAPGDYIAWATEIEGVGSAFVERGFAGGGTVRVILLDPQTSPVTDEVLAAATASIETHSPIGDDVTVTTPTTAPIDVSSNLDLEDNFTLDGVFADVQTNIATYLRGVPPGGIVYRNELAAVVVQTSGVKDYTTFQIGSPLGTTNITMTANVKPVLGVVTLT